MKMKVAYYGDHRTKDPYKFWSRLLDAKPKRKRRCVTTWTYVERIDENTLRFLYGREIKDKDGNSLYAPKEFCLLASNNTWTITAPVKDVCYSIGNRTFALMSVDVRPNRYSYGDYENPVRIKQIHQPSLPYEPGVQVFKGKILNPERYVDKKRTLDPKCPAAVEVKRKLKKIREVAPVMIRLLNAQGDRKKLNWYMRRKVKADLFAEFDLDNITAMDAERVYLLGEAVTSRPFHTLWNQGKPVGREYLHTDEQYQRRCIVNGLRKLREHIYSKEGVYQYKVVVK